MFRSFTASDAIQENANEETELLQQIVHNPVQNRLREFHSMVKNYYDDTNLDNKAKILPVDLPNVSNCQNPAEYSLIQQKIMLTENFRLSGFDSQGYNRSQPGGIYPTEFCL